MRLQDLSLSQRLAAGLGCVVTLALLVALLLYGIFEFIIGQKTREELDGAPAGWVDGLRTWGRSPDLAGLTMARTDSADGSVAAHDSAWAWHRAGVEQAYRAMIGAAPPSGVDSALWREVTVDTSLDRYVRAARARRWDGLARIVAADTLVKHNLLLMPLGNYAPVRDAGRALVIRGLVLLSRGDRAGAQRDLGAATALGEQLFRHEPTLSGALTGRALISSGARGWERVAAVTRDTTLARKAHAASDWASIRLDRAAELLLVAPDSALTLAADSSLALGLRGQAMGSAVVGSLVRPSGFVFGVPSRHLRRLETLAGDRDPDVAALGAIALRTARRTGLPHPSAIMHEVQERQR